MLLISLATLPSASEFFASTSEWSSPMFTDLLPFAMLAIGLFLGIALIYFIINALRKLF